MNQSPIQLAIVIPAYKATFLKDCLQSIENQTCKSFHLYIGDDCSPHDLYSIIEPFQEKLAITYTRFQTNLGGSDLVAQWERCIDMVQDEQWIWLFSDDDLMESRCVELFYQELRKNESPYLYHFDVTVIDEKGDKLKELANFPNLLTSDDFFIQRATNSLICFVVEFIFNKQLFYANKGFQNFDLAWGSDHATWIKLGHKFGIKTIEGSKVLWRKSSENISPQINDPQIATRKLAAFRDYYQWCFDFFNRKQERISRSFYLAQFVNNIKPYNRAVPLAEVISATKEVANHVGINNTANYKLYLTLHHFAKTIASNPFIQWVKTPRNRS